jgi:CRISPR-associated protein Csb1
MSESTKPPTSLGFELLQASVAGNVAAIRAEIPLEPAGGWQDKVFPPTYAGGVYATEKRLLDGKEVETVVLDSVQSQANRLEEALLRAFDEGRINLPVMAMTVPGYGRVTSLDAPHRIADAIFRDALLGGVPFHQSPDGQRFLSASIRDATAVFELCPTALVFGYWNSHAGLRTRGAKVPRALYSEIVGFGAVYGAQTGGRLDPLGIPRNAAKIYQASNESEMWTLEASQAKGEKGKEVLVGKGTDKGRPASIGHGNVPPDLVKNDRNEILRRGATLQSAKLTVVLSLAQLRRLHFPDASGGASRERNEAVRTVLAALGLAAVALQHEQGYDLRSRCVLYAPASLSLKFVGGENGEYNLTAATAIALLSDGIIAAERVGVVWRTGTVLFEPQKKLVQLYQKGLEAGPSEDQNESK